MSDSGAGEMGAPAKTTKASTPQEHPPVSTPPTYQEWAAAAYQFYSSGAAAVPPHGYFPPTVVSTPQPHPYMWGAQHLMPPFGTPPPFAAMYPYAHPSIPPQGPHPYGQYAIAPGSGADSQGNATTAGTDGEGKSGEAKTKSTVKRSKGSLGSLDMLTGKGSENGKETHGSPNGDLSNSHESGSEGSTDGSEGTSQNGSDGGQKANLDQGPYGGGQEMNPNGGTVQALPLSIAGKQVVGAGPLTNLNIGMDYWSGGAPPVLANGQGKRGAIPSNSAAIIPSAVRPARDVSGDLWLHQDERELKRQRRKQSNRESARRSRLRKQAECEELASKVHTLEAENASLRGDLARMTEQCSKLAADNRSLLEQVQMGGIEAESHTDVELDRNGVGHLREERGQ